LASATGSNQRNSSSASATPTATSKGEIMLNNQIEIAVRLYDNNTYLPH
jgi:hypothetical protein